MSFLYFYLWIASPLFEWKSEDRAPGTAPVLFRGVQGKPVSKKKTRGHHYLGILRKKKNKPGLENSEPK